jgi:fatty-acyl-CoA synthase
MHCHAEDEPLHAMPLYHSAGMHVMMLPYLAVGATNHIMESPDVPEVLRRVEADRIGALFLAPTVWVPLANHPDFAARDLSSLRKAFYGASIMPQPVLRRLREALPGLGFYNLFGQSEIGPLATVLQPDEHDEHPESCGRAVLFVELRVVDGEGKDVPPGELGEVVYRSPQLCTGYWNKPEETERVLVDGWFHTGDGGTIDDEGYVTISDRKKDVIITGGENVSSIEVEDVLFSHPAVEEVAVIGVPSEKWGETIKALVVLTEGATADEDELIDWCKQRLARYKAPTSVEFRETLARTATGKLQKFKLREPYWEGRERKVN